ncbi:MAG: class I SAM-dependent methyltransferase [Acidiferrobacterales bacterium]
MTSLDAHYSADDIESRILAALREAGLDPEQRLTPEELGALDHFHTGGYNASLRLLELSRIKAGDRVLDIGAGLAGPARMLAVTPGCDVDCIELSPDYCIGAALLNRITGLEDRVKMYEGSALDQPFDNNSFDAAWMQNVGMNIEDKRKLYEEIYRVLKPGARFAFQEMAAGSSPTSYFPLPWATEPSDNFLASIEEMHSLLGECGFVLESFEDASRPQPNAAPAPPPKVQLSLSVYVDNLAEKADNAMRSVQEDQIRFVRAVFRAEK